MILAKRTTRSNVTAPVSFHFSPGPSSTLLLVMTITLLVAGPYNYPAVALEGRALHGMLPPIECEGNRGRSGKTVAPLRLHRESESHLGGCRAPHDDRNARGPIASCG